MILNKKKTMSEVKTVRFGEFELERVENFKYLGMMIDSRNDRKNEVARRIQLGFKVFYSYGSIMKNKSISRRTKLKIYRTAIKPAVTYASETLTLSSEDEEQLRKFERKVIRKIFGPHREINGEYRRLMNQEIEDILEHEDICRTITSKRIRWYGHIKRMNSNSEVRRMTEWKPSGNRSRGRPKLRWKD